MDEIIYIVEDDEGIRELYEGAFEGVFLTKMFENGISVHIGKHNIENNKAWAAVFENLEKVLAVFKHFCKEYAVKCAFVKLSYAFVIFNNVNYFVH